MTTVYPSTRLRAGLAGLYEYQNGAGPNTTRAGRCPRRTGYATDNGVFYILSDQLRSTSVLVNQNGMVNSRNFYYPYGRNRGGSAFSGITTKRFTGQYHEQGLPGGEGLALHNVRRYDAQVGVFISADTLVPSPLAPQTFNRCNVYAGGICCGTSIRAGIWPTKMVAVGVVAATLPNDGTYGVWKPPVQKTWTWPRGSGSVQLALAQWALQCGRLHPVRDEQEYRQYQSN